MGPVGPPPAHHGQVAQPDGARVVPPDRDGRDVPPRRGRGAGLARVVRAPADDLAAGVGRAGQGEEGVARGEGHAARVRGAAGDADEAGGGGDAAGSDEVGVALGLAVAGVAPARELAAGGDGARVVGAGGDVGEGAGGGVALAEAVVAPAEEGGGEGDAAGVEEAGGDVEEGHRDSGVVRHVELAVEIRAVAQNQPEVAVAAVALAIQDAGVGAAGSDLRGATHEAPVAPVNGLAGLLDFWVKRLVESPQYGAPIAILWPGALVFAQGLRDGVGIGKVLAFFVRA